MIFLKRINFRTYSEEQARDSEKVHKKVQKRKKSQKGAFLGSENIRWGKYRQGPPVSDIGILWVAFFRNFLDFWFRFLDFF